MLIQIELVFMILILMLIISDILTMDNITYSEKVRGNFTGKVKWSAAYETFVADLF